MPNLLGQRVVSIDDAEAVAISNEVNVVYGQTATLLTKPAYATMLVLHPVKGDWNIRVGNVTGAMPAAFLPGAAVSDGTAGYPIKEGTRLTMPAPATLSVKGYAADSALTYYYV